MPYHRILIPVAVESDDGPALAAYAIELASALAQIQITLLGVIPPAPGRALDQTGKRDVEHERAAELAHSDRVLRECAVLLEDSGIEVATRTTASGDVAQEIIDRAAECADAIVMTSHARKGVKGLFMGSVANQVARHASVPVLVIAGADR